MTPPNSARTQLEDKWKMGRKGSDRGALVLLAVDGTEYKIEVVSYGLEGILPDGKVGDIGRGGAFCARKTTTAP